MSLVYFAERRVDAAVLEVGLGGRLDSTNICRPLVSVITSISFDHTRQLGNTLDAIAREKAGIIKPGVPVIGGATEPEPRGAIAAMAREQGAPLVELGRGIQLQYQPPRNLEARATLGTANFSCTAPGLEFDLRDVQLGLLGEHQAANAALAVTAIAALRPHGLAVPEAAIRQGLAEVCWPARIEVVGRRPTVVLDSAHNGSSIAALLRVLDESFSNPTRLLVFATTRDKDVAAMLRLLLPKFDRVIFTRYLENPRGVPPVQLADEAARLGGATASVAADPAAAWAEVQRLATPETLVCITGSLFTAAEMRRQIRQRPLE
jgi:dihydrofolate synthase/folylpolyglutamate synthase